MNHIISRLTRRQTRHRATLLFQWRNLGRFNEFPLVIDRAVDTMARVSRQQGLLWSLEGLFWSIYLFIFGKKTSQTVLSSSSMSARNGGNIQWSDEPRFSIPVTIVGNIISHYAFIYPSMYWFIYLFTHECVGWSSISAFAKLQGLESHCILNTLWQQQCDYDNDNQCRKKKKKNENLSIWRWLEVPAALD